MLLSDILKPEAVKSLSKPTGKKRVLQEIAAIASASYGLNSDEAFNALLDRESLGPTGVGEGVAIPHARLPGLNSVMGVFCRLDKPVDFESVDRQPVDIFFGLFAPEGSGVEHLKALALVSRLLRDPAIRSKIRSNEGESTLFAILTELAENKAA